MSETAEIPVSVNDQNAPEIPAPVLPLPKPFAPPPGLVAEMTDYFEMFNSPGIIMRRAIAPGMFTRKIGIYFLGFVNYTNHVNGLLFSGGIRGRLIFRRNGHQVGALPLAASYRIVSNAGQSGGNYWSNDLPMTLPFVGYSYATFCWPPGLFNPISEPLFPYYPLLNDPVAPFDCFSSLFPAARVYAAAPSYFDPLNSYFYPYVLKCPAFEMEIDADEIQLIIDEMGKDAPAADGMVFGTCQLSILSGIGAQSAQYNSAFGIDSSPAN